MKQTPSAVRYPGIRMRHETLARALREYEREFGVSPLLITVQLNPEYKWDQVTPPRKYRVKGIPEAEEQKHDPEI